MKSRELLRLGEEHLPAVAELERLCFPEEPWSEQSLRLLLSQGGVGVVAEEEGRVVAYGGMTLVLDEGSVTNVAVHPDRRHRGLGRAVVRALKKEALAFGIERIYLEVRTSNLPAISLYQSEGFTPCGTRKNFYRHPTEDALLMVLCRSEEKE